MNELGVDFRTCAGAASCESMRGEGAPKVISAWASLIMNCCRVRMLSVRDRRLVRRLTREAELGRTDPFGVDPRCCSSTLRGGVAPVIGTDERAGLPWG